MTLYLDTSVVLRWVLGQPDALAVPDADVQLVTSRLTRVECMRTLDRLRRQGRLSDEDYAQRHGRAHRILERTGRVHVCTSVLRRAAEPFPVPMRTLDGIHLATAMLYRDSRDARLVMATHDLELASGARAVGMDTIG